MGCGMFMTRHAGILSSTFQVSTGFMPSNAATVDPYVTTAQWSRRFLGVRLFLALAAAGWKGYAAHVERSIALIALLQRKLAGHGWRIANESTLAVLASSRPLARPMRARSVRACSRRVAHGSQWRSSRDVIRFASVSHTARRRSTTSISSSTQ